MFKICNNNIGYVFSVIIDGDNVDFNEWIETDDCIYYMPLSTLVDNGHAQVCGNECTVPYENVYLLDDDDKALLGLPEWYDKAIRLRSEGMLNTTDFRYKLEYLSHVPDGDVLVCERTANTLNLNGRKYLLNEYQYQLAQAVAEFNAKSEDERTTDFNLRNFAYIKELAIKADCELDSYLQNENVYVPDKVRIDIGHDEEGFTIEPAVNIEDNEKFQHAFERMRRIQSVYPVQKENGERIRIVLSPEQKESLDFLKKTGGKHRTREEIKGIIEQPTEYFDPEQFDLSGLYSDRVIEIGVYKPKFYPFVCPYQSCWIAGATVETPENGTTKILIENEEDLAELQYLINEAERNHQSEICYKDATIDIDDARFLAATARKQLKKKDAPIDLDEISEDREVLIIEDNAEDLGFSTKNEIIETSSMYTLYKNPYLNEGFSLKSHQEEGIAWLQHLYMHKASGCLMADDMGLGKTLQILYFIDWHSRQYPNHKPYLIVAPISLLENWQAEYKKFFATPRMKINILTSKDIPRQFNKNAIDMMQEMDIILTNYESLRVSQLNFCAVEFDVIALDEAQKIKSPGTLVTNAAKALKSNFKIAMTGTPVENSLLDLWCIMDFCVPGLLGNAKAFAAQYQNPLKSEDVDIVALGNEVHEKLGQYFMRRLKADVAKDLPEKIELKREVAMPLIQENTYIKVVDAYNSGIQPNMLLTIMDIREVSEHPYLYSSTLTRYESSELIETSARLKATISFLDKIKEREEKVIVFAERKEIQKMLQTVCWERYGIVAKIINGDTPTIVKRQSNERQSRQTSIDAFQAKFGFNIIIMSPIAAGMGLNVTGANHVVHYSRHWNPAKENQATDRAYRIGQTKDVYVYYPMATSEKFKSFDETLDELLSRKTALATSTIFPTERVEVRQDELAQMLFTNE